MIVLPGGGYAELVAHEGEPIVGWLSGLGVGASVFRYPLLVRHGAAPSAVRRVVLASSAPKGASGMRGWAPEVIDAVGKPETSPEEYIGVFFADSEESRAKGQEVAGRLFGARTVDRDAPTSWQTRLAQYDAVCTWGQPNHSMLERVSAIGQPVFVANGDSDPMILPHYSYLLAGLVPGARVKIYPDSAHGFLFQHHAEFAADLAAFLTSA